MQWVSEMACTVSYQCNSKQFFKKETKKEKKRKFRTKQLKSNNKHFSVIDCLSKSGMDTFNKNFPEREE